MSSNQPIPVTVLNSVRNSLIIQRLVMELLNLSTGVNERESKTIKETENSLKINRYFPRFILKVFDS